MELPAVAVAVAVAVMVAVYKTVKYMVSDIVL